MRQGLSCMVELVLRVSEHRQQLPVQMCLEAVVWQLYSVSSPFLSYVVLVIQLFTKGVDNLEVDYSHFREPQEVFTVFVRLLVFDVVWALLDHRHGPPEFEVTDADQLSLESI